MNGNAHPSVTYSRHALTMMIEFKFEAFQQLLSPLEKEQTKRKNVQSVRRHFFLLPIVCWFVHSDIKWTTCVAPMRASSCSFPMSFSFFFFLEQFQNPVTSSSLTINTWLFFCVTFRTQRGSMRLHSSAHSFKLPAGCVHAFVSMSRDIKHLTQDFDVFVLTNFTDASSFPIFCLSAIFLV